MGLHERAVAIYSTDNLQLSLIDIPDTSDIDKAFDEAMGWLYSNHIFSGPMLNEKSVRTLIEKTTEYLSKGIERGIEVSRPSELLVSKLHESVGIFSGFKTFHEMKEAANMLLDNDGNIKPFNRYLNDVKTINETYNHNYLRSEYNFAVASSEMAARWEDLADDGDGRYLLQYRTMGDERVRLNHRRLDGVTLPASDPFWELYYPPNGWGCRCTVAKVRAKNNPATNGNQALDAGAEATNGKHSEIFRFNPGKQKRVFPAHNSYTISKCTTCSISKVNLAKIPNNELCAACAVIRRMQLNRYDKTPTKSEVAKLRTEINKWVRDNLGREIINGVEAKRSYAISSNGNRIAIGQVFFNEVLAKSIRNPQLPSIMEATIHFDEWIKTSEFVRIEKGRHHNYYFSVYRSTWKNRDIEYKCKITEGELLYIMRFIEK